MLNKEEKKQYRAELFRHLDGLVVAPVAYSLYKKGVLQAYLEEGSPISVVDMVARFSANEGNLNVALRLMASQGWLKMHLVDAQKVSYSASEKLENVLPFIPWYKHAVDLLAMSGNHHERRFEREPFEQLKKLFEWFMPTYAHEDSSPDSIRFHVLKHIEGYIVGPSTVHLGMSGMFHKYFMEASFRPEEFHKDAHSFGELLDIFMHLGWFKKQNDTLRFTDKGLFFAQRASAYGVTVSYLPMFRKIDELIFGDPYCLRPEGYTGPELHVDREMNVWGSGGAHAAYFKQVDEVIIDLFNRPIAEQPKGILDMGCGNGAFLIHIFDVIEQRTLRGRMLEEYPLFLVGADYNEAALRVTRANLIQADIWAKVIWGDIGNPDRLSADLREHYGIELSDLLNVRTFLDHNRIWEPVLVKEETVMIDSTGAFAHRGKHISNAAVEANLVEHFKKWAPFVSKYGLLLIELHTIAPELAAANPGRTAVCAYDATHGFSDQYIVEIAVLHRAAAKAGLHLDENHFHRYPNSDLATISINLFKGV